nr:atherin-like [Aegilops tauschii subsp. strangulata]
MLTAPRGCARAPRLHRGLPPFAPVAMAVRALHRACLPPTPRSLGLAFVPPAAVCSAIATAAVPDRRTTPWPRRFRPPLRPPTRRPAPPHLRLAGPPPRRGLAAAISGARAASAPLRSRGSSPGSGAYNARVPVAAPAPGRRRHPERSPACLLLLSAVVPVIHLAHRCHDPYALREPRPSLSSSLPQHAASPLPRCVAAPFPLGTLTAPRCCARASRLHRGLPPFAPVAKAARALRRACLPPTPRSLGLAFVPPAAVCSAIAAAAAPDRRTASWSRRFRPPLRPPTRRPTPPHLRLAGPPPRRGLAAAISGARRPRCIGTPPLPWVVARVGRLQRPCAR